MAKIRVEDREQGVRLITLADPERRNAMDDEMGAALRAAAGASAEDGTRVLVVTGDGPAFCAGADLPELFGEPDRPVIATRERLQTYYRAFLEVRALPIPTIAAVNGPAVGAGLNLALACDLRIAGPGASFGVTFARIGLHPGGGATWFLVHTLGPSRALRALLLGEVIEADHAVAWGLAEGIEQDPLDSALDLAKRMAQVDPTLARHIKRGVRLAVETDDLNAVLEYESWAQAASASSDELRAWVERFRR